MRILFLDLDTLRADHLSCYGYHRKTSPYIDWISSQGVRFENYYCSDAPCLPSRAALMTGRFGIHTGVVGHGGTAADLRLQGRSRGFRDRCAVSNWPALLKQAGFQTVTISPFAERHGAWWFYAGFTQMYNPGLGGMESAEHVTPLALNWLKNYGQQDNWFLHVNYWDPHTPYRAPAEFGNPFLHDPLPDWLTAEVLEKHRSLVGPHCARELAMYDNQSLPQYPRYLGEIKNLEDLKFHLDNYDCGIRYTDQHIGQLIETLDKLKVLEETAIIVTADHGENQGELGIYAEHGTADEATCHIPMIIRWPGGLRGKVDKGFHYQLDWPPTLACLLGKEVNSTWEGRSYASSILKGEETGYEQLILSQCAHVCQRSVRFGPWLYIRTYHDGYHLFPEEMLFHLKEDPHEQKNLAESHPEVCGEAARRLENWHSEMMATSESSEDPMWVVLREGGPAHARGRLKSYCEYLRKTGRAWAIEELKRRHPGEFSSG